MGKITKTYTITTEPSSERVGEDNYVVTLIQSDGFKDIVSYHTTRVGAEKYVALLAPKRFILIDSVNRKISEVFCEGETLKFMQKAVNGYIETAVRPDERNDIFVNDNGMLLGADDFFVYEGAHQPFAGNGIVTGNNDDGETVSTTLSLEEVKSKVKFYHRLELRKMM